MEWIRHNCGIAVKLVAIRLTEAGRDLASVLGVYLVVVAAHVCSSRGTFDPLGSQKSAEFGAARFGAAGEISIPSTELFVEFIACVRLHLFIRFVETFADELLKSSRVDAGRRCRFLDVDVGVPRVRSLRFDVESDGRLAEGLGSVGRLDESCCCLSSTDVDIDGSHLIVEIRRERRRQIVDGVRRDICPLDACVRMVQDRS